MIAKYSEGFLNGAAAAKNNLLATMGGLIIESLSQFVDANARSNPSALHHIYEWNQTGSPSARLFDLDYFISGAGLTFKSSFRQSSSIKNGSTTPFYDKARIMEQGIPVVIKPKMKTMLRFTVDGEEVFTRNPVRVNNPGGEDTVGSFQKTIDIFFNSYFSQAFLQVSGIMDIMDNTVTFSKNLPRAKAGGKAAGYDVGYRWIAFGGKRI